MSNILIFPICIPLLFGLLVILTPARFRIAREFLSLTGTLLNLVLCVYLFGKNINYSLPWAGFGIEFSLNLKHFSSFIIAAASVFAFLVTLYTYAFGLEPKIKRQFYLYLLASVAFLNGAVLSDNLALTLFFWEGLLVSLFAMIAIGKQGAFKTATKAFIITGIADLCMMFGIVLTGYLAGTFTISKISLPVYSLGGVAFTLLMIGAIAKSGSMPFHSWIPDAATDAPLPFMALIPAAFEKLLGIYFLARISLDMFKLEPGSWASFMLMIIGAITIVLAVMMALIQKDYKRLLSYHAISQVGYMILGIGTAIPIGIIGGLFHMLNNAMYKSCLFLTGGSVEKAAGTTDLSKLGGIGRKMPITFICFLITAASISGVPPFNGFFSKELLYAAALQRGVIFYLAASIGTFFTAMSFLKLGHAAYLGNISTDNQKIKESPWQMLIPMIIISALCLFFGVFNKFVVNNFFVPVLRAHEVFAEHANIKIMAISVLTLIGATVFYLAGFKKNKSALKAIDSVHYAPVLHNIYDNAEKGNFDPYIIGYKFADTFSKIGFVLDRAIDWLYDSLAVKSTEAIYTRLKKLHTGNYSFYLGWSLLGMFVVVVFLIYSK